MRLNDADVDKVLLDAVAKDPGITADGLFERVLDAITPHIERRINALVATGMLNEDLTRRVYGFYPKDFVRPPKA